MHTGTTPGPQPSHDALVAAAKLPKTKKSRKSKQIVDAAMEADAPDDVEDIDDLPEDLAQTLREFDRDVRLNAFQFHTHTFCDAIVRRHYDLNGNLKDTSQVYIDAEKKFDDNTRTFKTEFIKRLKTNMREVSVNRPDVWVLEEAEFKNELYKILTQTSFQHCWYYLDGMVDLEGSDPLGQYFIRCKSSFL